MPTSCFHSAGGSGGFGPGSSAIDDCESAREGKQLRATTARIGSLIRRKRESAGTPGFLLGGPAFDQVVANIVTESGCGGDGNRATGRDFDGRIDEVFFPIAFAGGNVARQSVAGQGRDGDVVNAPDAAFQHAAAPDRNVVRQAEGLDLPGAGVAADAAQLDVNDARCVQVESSLRITRVANGFVEANRSTQLLLELGVVENVIPPKRLLHHQ